MLGKSNTPHPSIVDTRLARKNVDAQPPCERALELACEIEKLLVQAESDGSLTTRGEVLSVRFAQAFARNLIDQLSELRRTGAA